MTEKLPKIDLATFFLSISSAAFMSLGVLVAEEAGAAQVDLEMARQNIDLLELMLQKTQGNRTPEEDHLLQQLLFETRMKYLEKQKELSKT